MQGSPTGLGDWGGTFENLSPPLRGGTAGGGQTYMGGDDGRGQANMGGDDVCGGARACGGRRDTIVNDICKKKWRVAPKFLHFWT